MAGILALAAAGAGTYLALRPAQSAPAYRTMAVTATTLTDTVSASGTITPAQQANLSFPSGSKITAVQVGVGDVVKAGQVLAQADPSNLQVALKLAQADLTAAQQNLASLQDAGSTSTSIASASATVQVKQNALTQAQQNLAGASLTAPFDGIVAQVSIAVGDVAGSQGGTTQAATTTQQSGTTRTSSSSGSSASSASSSAAIVVISQHQFLVNTTVSSADIAHIKKGLQATITPAGAAQPVFGTVSSVGIVATTSGSSTGFPVQIKVTGSPTGLLAGASAQVQITVAEIDNVIAVPTQAISTTNGQTTVNTLVDGAEVATNVTIGQSIGNQTVITAGLAEGDQVIVGTQQAGANTGRGASGTATSGARGNRTNQQGAQPAPTSAATR